MEGVLFCSDRWAVFPHPTPEGLGGLSSAPLNCWEPAPGAPRWLAPGTCARLGWRHRRARKRQDSWEKPTLHSGRQHLKLWPQEPAVLLLHPPVKTQDDRDPGTGVSGRAAVPLLQEAGGTSYRTPATPWFTRSRGREGEGDPSPGRLSCEAAALYLINY